MAEEPTLPQLPPPRSRAPPSFAEGRKRARGTNAPSSLSSSTSSDPAVFSSDDDPALDNYVHGRRKKRYVGTWFDQQPASSDSADSAIGDDMRRPMPKPPKRQFRRQLDSGVFLGMDGSTDTDESVDLEPRPSKLPLGAPSSPPVPLQFAVRRRISPEEQKLRDIVNSCVEEGKEEIDLGNLNVESISDGSLEPLESLMLVPKMSMDVAYEHRDPSMRVFLSNNRLRKFPTALVNIEHITFLSLRANRLRELPPSIASMKNLEVLNIAQNSLRYLPSELLELLKKGSKLRDLLLHPNPYYQPKERSYCRWGTADYEEQTFVSSPDFEVESMWSGVTTTLRSRTPVQFIDSARNVCSAFRFPPTDEYLPFESRKLEQEDFWEVAVPKVSRSDVRADLRGVARARRGPPSLFELVLRAAMMAHDADQLAAVVSGDGYPQHLSSVLERAVEIEKMGGQRCSVCRRQTWSPATEWVEFREVQRTSVKLVERDGMRTEVEQSTKMAYNSDESWVPFMRKGCSWSCIPFKAPLPPGSEERTRLLLIP
ncbi:CCR4-NOT transcription complex subunit 6-like-B [Naviculisporaceae sp. PSN 640]